MDRLSFGFTIWCLLALIGASTANIRINGDSDSLSSDNRRVPIVRPGLEQPIPMPNFNCTPLNYPPPPASNVRQLRPGNIKAIMALGDSITAGFGMQGYPPWNFEEWRGYVFSIGGQSDAYTLATCMQNYNPNLQGAAMGNTWPLTKGAWLDAGVSMARVEQVPSQIDYLVNTLKTQYASTVDFKNDWKLLTLFIGANNLCGSCRNNSNTMPAFWEKHLTAVLSQIQAQIPRVFVNVMTIFNISGVWDAGQTSLYCRTLWQGITNGECGCLTTGKAADRLAMDIRAQEFNAITERVVAQFAALNDPQFTAVVQPGIQNLNVAKYGEGFLSSLDCFHPNLYANWAFTYAIWNNMFEPVGKKSSTPDPNNIHIYCPTDSDFLQ